jgi:hypothetical protein
MLELLEQMNVAEARQLLEISAQGAPGTWLIKEAKSTLERRTHKSWMQSATAMHDALSSWFQALLLNLEKWKSGEDRWLPSFTILPFREVQQQSHGSKVVPQAERGRQINWARTSAANFSAVSPAVRCLEDAGVLPGDLHDRGGQPLIGAGDPADRAGRTSAPWGRRSDPARIGSGGWGRTGAVARRGRPNSSNRLRAPRGDHRLTSAVSS